MVKTAAIVGALTVLLGGTGVATAAERVLVAKGGASYRQMGALGQPPSVSLRGGAMFAPNSAGVAGLDIAMPGLAFFDGWEGRLDADVIFTAKFADVKTVVPVSFSQVNYSRDVSGRALYVGAGAGAVLGGDTKLMAKGIVGIELHPRLGVEGNVLFTKERTMFLVVGRLHL